MKILTKQQGFTIIELMFSTVIFSTILLISLAALVQIGRLYYKGVTTSQTQQTARKVMDEISQSIEFTGSGIFAPTLATPPNPKIPVSSNNAALNVTGYFCVGGTRYTYVLDRQQKDSPNLNAFLYKQIKHVLWADDFSNCASAPLPLNMRLASPSVGTNGRELMGANMRITRLDLRDLTGASGDHSTWQIIMNIAYGDEDLLAVDTSVSPKRITCTGAQIGTQFCATSELTTIVKKRVL